MTPPRTQSQRTDDVERGAYPENWAEIASFVKAAFGGACVRCRHKHDPANGFTLTVHHLDMTPANCQPYNLAVLCQRCHLAVQGRVDFAQTWMLEHSQWMAAHVSAYGVHLESGPVEPLSPDWKRRTGVLVVQSLAGRTSICVCPGWVGYAIGAERDPMCFYHGPG